MAEIEGSLPMDAVAIPASGPYALRINRNDPYLVRRTGRRRIVSRRPASSACR